MTYSSSGRSRALQRPRNRTTGPALENCGVLPVEQSNRLKYGTRRGAIGSASGTEEGRWKRRGRQQQQPPEEEVRWKKGTEERPDLVAGQKKEAATELGRMGSPVPSRLAGVGGSSRLPA